MTGFSVTLGEGVSVSLPALPYWQGVRKQPEAVRKLPFSLGLDHRGFVRQTTDPSVIAATVAAYSAKDYSFITAPPGSSAWGTRVGEKKLAALEAMIGRLDGKRILEIGGATLYLAKVICTRYHVPRYVCVDPALRRSEDDPLNVETLQTYFPADDVRGEKFDLIIANSCLEHVPDLVAFLNGMREVLSDGGVVFCTFPDVGRCFRDGDLNALLHEHINYLDEPTARMLFASVGLPLARWRCEGDLASCVLAKGNLSLVDGARIAAANLLMQAIEGLISRLAPAAEDILNRATEGGRIAFYGATNGLNSFLAWADSEPLRTASIIDGDQAKKGQFLPACKSPIRWLGETDCRAFDAIVITAASFQEEIISTLTEKNSVPKTRIVGLFKPLVRC